MQNFLYFNVLDAALFPELERPPGVYAIEAALVDPKREERVPAPKGSPAVLLVSYTLLATAVPRGSAWQLDAVGMQRDGKPRHISLALMEPPPQIDNMQPIDPDPSIKLAPGTVFRQVFWLDLGPPLSAGILLPGDTITLRYGSASATLVLPALGFTPRR